MCPVNSKTVTQWKPHQPSMNQRIPLITFFRASLPIYGTLFSKLKLHIYYISEFLMQIRSSWASCSSQMKFWAVIQISSVSDVMMDVHTSQINCERSTLLHKYKQWFTCVWMGGSVCEPRSHKFTQLGNYMLQMAASRGERAKVTGENIIAALTSVWKCSKCECFLGVL